MSPPWLTRASLCGNRGPSSWEDLLWLVQSFFFFFQNSPHYQGTQRTQLADGVAFTAAQNQMLNITTDAVSVLLCINTWRSSSRESQRW